MNKYPRNSPCWCGSGKKYKTCHLNRETQEPANLWEAIQANKEAFHAKKCLAGNSNLKSCFGKIVKAHTVSKGANLSKIARNSKVYSYQNTSVDAYKKSKKILIPTEIGIGVASVFNGFCSKHDRELFSCIENEIFTGRPDQCLAIAYRTLSRELYGKQASLHLKSTLNGADKGKSILQQKIIQYTLFKLQESSLAAVRELSHTYNKLTDALSKSKNDILTSLIIELDGDLPFMLAGAWSPFSDLYGKELQIGYADALLEQIFLSSFAGSGNSYFCISWLNIEHAPGSVIANQIVDLPANQQAGSCLQLATKYIENIFFSPNWFEELKPDQLNQLETLSCSGMQNLGAPPEAEIKFSMDFNLPDIKRIFKVNGPQN